MFLLLTVFLVSCGPKVELIFIDSVKGIAKVQVALGTTQAEVMNELPTKVTITDNKGKNYEITASWALNGYDKDTVGTYTAKGTFTLPVGVSQKTPPVPLEVTVQIEVIRPQLHSVTALNEKYYVLLGTAKATAMTKLPTSTTVKDNLGKTYEVELNNWVCPTYNANAEADYPASATFEVPAQINDNSEVSKTVTTKLSVSNNRTLKSILPVKNVTVSVNSFTREQVLVLMDSKVKIVDSNDSEHDLDLTWDLSAYDGSKIGEYTVSATFSLPSNVKNTVPPMELKVSAKITVASQQGSGTSGDPYIIENLTQLLMMKDKPDKHYKLKENIKIVAECVTDNLAQSWKPVGTASAPFTGSFDGNGSTVELQFIGIASSGSIEGENIGMFGVIGSTGVVKNLNFEYVFCHGKDNVGGLAGTNNGKIQNCYVKQVSYPSSVSHGVEGMNNVGMFVGVNNGTVVDSKSYGNTMYAFNSAAGGFVGYNSGTIEGCAVIDGTRVSTHKEARAGGFVGVNTGDIIESSSDINVSDGTALDYFILGGFAGKNETTGNISYCVSSGTILGYSAVQSAGFVLENKGTIDKSYSNMKVKASTGKIYGFGPGTTGITNCYWICYDNNQYQAGSATGLTEAAAKKTSSYLNWNFGDKWVIDTEIPILARTLPVKYDEGDGSLANPFVIKNFEQLNAMRWRLSKHYILAQDIRVNDKWYPVGSYLNEEIRYFTGSFDGNNKTIDNLRIGWMTKGSGMFGYVKSAVIKNIKFTNANVNSGESAGLLVGFADGVQAEGSTPSNFTKIDNIQIMSGIITGAKEVGGLIGRGNKTEITNVSVKANVSGNEYVGGVAGYLEIARAKDILYEGNTTGTKACGGIAGKFIVDFIDGTYIYTVQNIASKGKVSGEYNVGGLIGQAWGKYENISSESEISGKELWLPMETGSGIGGLFGFSFGSDVKNSFFKGQITMQKGFCGGLVGYAEGGNITDCYLQGSINYIYADTTSFAGGILGDGQANISGCYSCGSISGSNYSAGLVGRFRNTLGCTIKDSYSRGSAYAGLIYSIDNGIIENCYSTVKTVTQNAGLVFKATTVNASAKNCFWDTEASKATSTAVANNKPLGIGKTTAEMKTQGTYTGWDFTNIWAIDALKNDGYPYLK